MRRDNGGVGRRYAKIEEEVSNLFPEARVARLDSDTAAVAGKESEIVRDLQTENRYTCRDTDNYEGL